jgi:transcriptional regulator with XRE-family HTH domain
MGACDMSDFSEMLRRLMEDQGTGLRELAREVPCNPGHLSYLRSGKRRPSPEIALRLDDILQADGSLAGSAGSASRPAMPWTLVSRPALALAPSAAWARSISEAVLNPTDAERRALLTWEDNGPTGSLDLQMLSRAVSKARTAELSSDYAQLADTLPDLIGQAELAIVRSNTADESQARCLASDVHVIAGWSLIKADCPAVAWVAAQRAIQLAEQADDVFRSAAATRCLSEVHMRAENFEEASRTAFLAATYLDTARASNRAVVLCLRGAALLSAAAAGARRGDSREAFTSLKAAAVCADGLGENRADLGAVFGPANVAIHQVAVAVELGSAREAVRHITKVDLARLPAGLRERRSRFLIDVARSHARLHDDSAALGALLEAEQIAPHEVRNHRCTRETLRELGSREQRSSGLRALADRCMVLD